MFAKSTIDSIDGVTRFHEDPRVTLPYTDEQWKRIHQGSRNRIRGGRRSKDQDDNDHGIMPPRA